MQSNRIYNSPDVRIAKMDDLMPLMLEGLENGRTVTFSPRGISMLPMLVQGRDSVVLSPVKGRLKKYDIPLYKRDDGSYILHRVVKVGEAYTCIGDNQFDYEHGVTHESIIGVVSEFTRKGKKYSVNALSYKLYCRFRHFSRPLRKLWRKIKRKLHKIGKK